MNPRSKSGLVALVIAVGLIWTLPAASVGKGLDLRKTGEALRELGTVVQQTVSDTEAALRAARERTEAALRKTKRELAERQARLRQAGHAARATASDPARQPPLHGATPHGQGGVAVVDVNPSNERPLGASANGSDSGEDAIVGRARGEQTAGGTYNGHITIASLFGNELAGVNTGQGETKNGPLQPIQTGVLDPLCNSTGQQVCLSVLTANSTTTASGSDNDFALARASVLGLGVGAAESRGTITTDANCQTSTGSARTANVTAGTGAVAQVANSTSSSKSCRGQAPQTANTSMVIGLGGVQLPLPAAGCDNGTADTVAGLPGVLPIVCNADEIAGAAAVREALDVFVLQVGSTSLAKETTAASESLSVAPKGPETAGGPACSDGVDNDGDRKIDAADPGCHSDNDANNPGSFVPSDNDETDRTTTGPRDDDEDEDTTPDDGDDGGGGRPECSDRVDNDGDGAIDDRDPGCDSPSDDSEDDGKPGLSAGSLPFTGSDVVGLGFAGLLLLAGGLLLRRREGAHGGW